MDGYIKLHRKILDWGWWTDATTTRVFIYLLLSATYTERDYLGTHLMPGDLVCSVKGICGALNLTTQNVRTALKHLEQTGEITITSTSRYTVISITNWTQYQVETGEQAVTQPKEKKAKTPKKTTKEFVPPTLEEVREYVREKGYNADPEKFYRYYEATGWTKANGKQVVNWKGTLVANWIKDEPVPTTTQPTYSAARFQMKNA